MERSGHLAMDKVTAGELEPGTVFAGRYRIVCLLGQGERKRTYEAHDTMLNRRVAVAIVKPEAAKVDPDGARREVEILSRIGQHDNIVTLHDFATTEGVDYIVFAYLPGGTLRDYIRARYERHNPLSPDQVMLLGRQLARALSHLHRRGLVHRDVSATNIWLDDRQVVHLGDFDSATRRRGPQDPDPVPPTNKAYAAPEQLAGQPVDERSDLYSLGAVLFEAATGQAPATGGGVLVPRTLRSFRPDLHRSFIHTVSALLSVSPAERPASAEAVLEQLKRANDANWIETLPFPLASILWLYLGEAEPHAKIEHLLKFFEALAQFDAAILLSVLRADDSLLAGARNAAIRGGSDNGNHPALGLATFGSWVHLADRLGSAAREVLQGRDGGRELWCQLLGAPDIDLMEAITDEAFISVLYQARNYRNAWEHGPVVGPREQEERVALLETLLQKTRNLIGLSFETWTLLKPESARYRKGTFDWTVTVLVGPNSTFRKQRIQLTHPLEADQLYLVSQGSARALELVPLIRILPSGKASQEACYFYNRRQGPGDDVRWVSYHFHGEPEQVRPDPDVVLLLRQLSAVEEASTSV